MCNLKDPELDGVDEEDIKVILQQSPETPARHWPGMMMPMVLAPLMVIASACLVRVTLAINVCETGIPEALILTNLPKTNITLFGSQTATDVGVKFSGGDRSDGLLVASAASALLLLVPDALPCDTDGQHCNLFDILSLQRHSHDSSAPVANLTARLDDELRAFNQPVLPPIDKALRSLFAAYELICWVATASDFCIGRYVVNVTSLLKRSAKKSAKQVTRPLAPPS